ncbi:MAG: YchJ family protein [Steroidobacter sp.]|jgi:SEC-C motif-containing protein
MRKTAIKPDMKTTCPCGSMLEYTSCCGRYHAGGAAPTAEALMRSRYTAFVMQNETYLLDTWHVSKRPASVPFEAGTKWLGLQIIDRKDIDADHAEVEFIARYRVGGASAQRGHERSRFIRENGRWFYVSGEVPKK